MVKYSKLPRTISIWNKYIQKNEIDSTQDVTPKKLMIYKKVITTIIY